MGVAFSETAFSETALSASMLGAVARARIGVIVADRDGEVLRTVYASRVAAELLGTTVEALLAGDAKLLVAERDRAEALRISTAVRRGEAVEMPFEMTALEVDGTPFAAELAVTPVEVQGRTFMISFFWSVEERKRAQQAALALDALFKRVIEGAPDAVVVSRDGHVLWANGSAARLFGVPDGSLGGRSVADFITPEEPAAVRARTRAVLEGREPAGPREYRLRRGDGGEALVESTAMAIDWKGAPAVLSCAT